MTPGRLLVPLIAAWLHVSGAGALAARPASQAELRPALQPERQPAAGAHQYGIRLLHTRWLAQDGAPRDIQSITQTPDGWLWLGTKDGVYRFDGIRFDRYRPTSGARLPSNLYKIGSLPDGTVWAIPFFGGIYLLRDDAVRAYGEQEGLPGGSANQVVRTADGRLWGAFHEGLYVLDPGAGKWRLASRELGLDDGAFDVLIDRQGTLWVQTGTGNYAMRQGERIFRLVARQATPGSLAMGPDGTVWAVDGGKPGLVRLSAGSTPPALAQGFRRMATTQGIHIDRHGGFWFPRMPGIARLVMDGDRLVEQLYTTAQGLSGDTPVAAFTDREGNIWVSTAGGLDQFRPSRLRELALPPKVTDARPLVAGPAGELWTEYLFLPDIHARPQDHAPAPDRYPAVQQMFRDRDGTILFGTEGRLWKLDGHKPVAVPLPPEVAQAPQQTIFSIARAGDGALWISLGKRGTWRLRDGRWSQHGGIAALKDYMCTTISAGPDGRLWFGSLANSLAVLHAGSVRKLGANDGLDIGSVLSILPDADGAWLAGDEGLARYDGRRFARIVGEDGEQFQGGTGIVRDDDGTLWINGSRGLVSIGAAALRGALADAAGRVRYRRYDENDGLRGAPAMLYPSPSLVLLPGGHLAVSTTGGVFHLDTKLAALHRDAPPVHVTGIEADGKAYAPGAIASLPAAPETVRIDYTALGLAQPRRVRFEYMLDGVDSTWQGAGSRRSAQYTQLRPGSYTFRVRAASEDGAWGAAGASMRFAVPPTLAQSTWFRVLCGLAVLLAAYGLHRLRLRMAIARLDRIFEARVAERERVARDLHDTLLQSVQALLLQFRRIAARTPDDAPTRASMLQAIEMATETLEEGRDKVGELRATFHDQDLAALLDVCGRRMQAGHATAFSLQVQGVPRPLPAPVLDELVAIGREAIRNAYLHAQASRVDVLLDYGEREFGMHIADDGIGIDAARQGGRAEHWGIPGMRERAAELGVALHLDSAPGRGTAWQLRMPARLAYAASPDETATSGTVA